MSSQIALVLILMKFDLRTKKKKMFSLLHFAFKAISKIYFPNVKSQRFSTMHFPVVIQLGVMCSIIHFESTVVYDVKCESKLICLVFGLE